MSPPTPGTRRVDARRVRCRSQPQCALIRWLLARRGLAQHVFLSPHSHAQIVNGIEVILFKYLPQEAGRLGSAAVRMVSEPHRVVSEPVRHSSDENWN